MTERKRWRVAGWRKFGEEPPPFVQIARREAPGVPHHYIHKGPDGRFISSTDAATERLLQAKVKEVAERADQEHLYEKFVRSRSLVEVWHQSGCPQLDQRTGISDWCTCATPKVLIVRRERSD